MMKRFRARLLTTGFVQVCRPSGPVLPDFTASGLIGGGTTSIVECKANGKDATTITLGGGTQWTADFEDVPVGNDVPLFALGNDGSSDEILITVSQVGDTHVTWSCVQAAHAEDSPEAAQQGAKRGKVLCEAMEFRIPRTVNPKQVAVRFVTSEGKYDFEVKGVLTGKAKSVTVQAGDHQ